MQILSIIIAALSLSTVGASVISIHFKAEGGKQAATMTKGDSLVVTFEGIPSTGYAWKLNGTSNAIETVLKSQGSKVSDVRKYLLMKNHPPPTELMLFISFPT